MELRSAGRYELLEEIGRGAMGVVYKALDPLIGRAVAVKLLRVSEEGTGLSRTELLARFQNEVRAAGRINHPNIVVVHDTGEESGRFYITMEYVEGRSLQALMDRRQTFPLPRVLQIFSQACSAMDAAHRKGVVHRDIKPANLLMTSDDTLKITDFGTAKILQIGAGQTATVMGTPSYMSPEQVKGKAVDGRSDIFSLGVILYEMITGEKPFPGQNITTVIYKIVNEDPIPPSRLDASIHPGLNVVIRRALAKEPTARYQTCAEFLESLRNYRSLDVGPEATQPLSKQPATTVSRGNVTTGGRPAAAAPPIPAAGKRAEVQVPSAPVHVPMPSLLSAPVEPPRKKARHGFVVALLLAIVGWTSYLAWPAFESILAYSGANEVLSRNEQPAQKHATTKSGSDSPTGAIADSAEAKLPAGASAPAPKSLPKIAETGAPHKPVAATSSIAAPAKKPNDISPAKSDAPGSLQILTEVPGARAILRNVQTSKSRQCTTPCRIGELPAGRYTLNVQKEHFRATQRAISISSGMAVTAQVPLEPVSAELLVVTEPPQAEIFVNGRRRQETTPTTLLLAPGRYTVLARKEGLNPAQTIVELKDRDTRRISLELESIALTTGWVEVRSNPAGAEILVNDEPTGKRTPARLELPAGIHTLTLKLAGFAPQTRTILIEAHRTVIQSQILPAQ